MQKKSLWKLLAYFFVVVDATLLFGLIGSLFEPPEKRKKERQYIVIIALIIIGLIVIATIFQYI